MASGAKRLQARRFGFAWGALACVLASACESGYDTVGQLDGVRVLGVQKSEPMPQPGTVVTLDMLYHDTGQRGPDEIEGEPRDISTLWISGCENPPGDTYLVCTEGLSLVLSELDIEGPLDEKVTKEKSEFAALEAAGIQFGFGTSFEFEVAEDLISRRAAPINPAITPYGLNYVMFAACAGQLEVDTDDPSFPVVCTDEDGEKLTQKDFQVGFTTLFTYDGIRNSNPVIEDLLINGKSVDEDAVCLGDDCESIAPDPDRECGADDVEVELCPDEDDSSDCDTLDVEVVVEPNSIDEDQLLSEREGAELDEQMWVNYYSDRGGFDFDLALINDVNSGRNQDPAVEYTPDHRAGPVHIWAVVRDNRGGTEWARVRVCVVEP